jgi:hypothetical protein
MDPDRTTTMGEEESVVMERPFQSMNAVLSTRAKFRIWVHSWRGWREVREENMLAVFGGWGFVGVWRLCLVVSARLLLGDGSGKGVDGLSCRDRS